MSKNKTNQPEPRLISQAEAVAIRAAESRPKVETAAEREQRRILKWCEGADQRMRDQTAEMTQLMERAGMRLT